jgi:hypothetical protein
MGLAADGRGITQCWMYIFSDMIDASSLAALDSQCLKYRNCCSAVFGRSLEFGLTNGFARLIVMHLHPVAAKHAVLGCRLHLAATLRKGIGLRMWLGHYTETQREHVILAKQTDD